MNELLSNTIYFLIAVLFVFGLYGMLDKRNLMKKLMAMNIMQVSVIIFFLALGQKLDATLPILVHGLEAVDQYVNPLPHALMLTAIVVSLSTTGVALALLLRIQDRYEDLEEPEILRGMDK